jgi:peptidyl-dipeptidase A
MTRSVIAVALCGPMLGLACASSTSEKPEAETQAETAPPPPTPEEARAFVKQLNEDLQTLWTNWARAEWVKATYITHDTEILAAKAHEKVLEYTSRAIEDATRFDGLDLDSETRRMLTLLKTSSSLPAPSDPDERARLAEIAAKMESIYGKGEVCEEDDCRDLGDLSEVMSTKRDYDALLDAWQGWRTISPPMRPMYEEFVRLANEGANEIGYDDLGELWRAGYDMTPSEFEAVAADLWNDVKPLYESLHCYVRGRLAKKYGTNKVDPDGLIPAHLLGNMWAQEWSNIYPLVAPYPGVGDLDVTAALKKKNYDAMKMVKLGESFFTSLGLEPLPETFWERSMFTKPEDRDVVCHASAWDVTSAGDIRIKMCIRPTEEDLITIHHELGHNYYYQYYYMKPVLFQAGAHDGFHEGIGDTLALSVTPGYLEQVGILDRVAENEKALINLQLKEALDKIAFLPFGKLIDEWRWKVFAGEIPFEDMNAAWWKLRAEYQGIAPPVARTEADFDPGAKYHIPSNVPYTRYFLARILQFQFHEALCEAAGHEGPLHTCSIYGSQEAGERLRAMLALGASRPWPDALEAIAGTREMDGTALVAYFRPLLDWLEKQNEGQSCGWEVPVDPTVGTGALTRN